MDLEDCLDFFVFASCGTVVVVVVGDGGGGGSEEVKVAAATLLANAFELGCICGVTVRLGSWGGKSVILIPMKLALHAAYCCW